MADKSNHTLTGSLTDDQLRYLGALTTNEAHLDYFLEVLIWQMAEIPIENKHVGPILTDLMGDRQRQKVLRRLAKHLDQFEPGIYQQIANFTNRVKRLKESRNNLIHGVATYSNTEEHTVFLIKHQSEFGPGYAAQKIPTAHIQDAANRAKKLSNECTGLIATIHSAQIAKRRALRNKS